MNNFTLDEILDDYDSADQVAERFTAAGIKAVPNEPCECAVARYVQLYEFAEVSVMHTEADGYVVEADNDVYFIGEEGALADFIRAFDAGAYPQLVSGGAA